VRRKIPPEAFSHYLSLGQSRSYESVAAHFNVSKRAITNLAVRENWQMKLKDAERQAREKAEEKALESLEEMNLRHLKTVQLIQRKALDGMRTLPLASGIDCVRALTLALEKERLIRGEPTDRSALNVEEIIKREYALLMVDANGAVTRGGHGDEAAANEAT
jgi:hypothetical protein